MAEGLVTMTAGCSAKGSEMGLRAEAVSSQKLAQAVAEVEGTAAAREVPEVAKVAAAEKMDGGESTPREAQAAAAAAGSVVDSVVRGVALMVRVEATGAVESIHQQALVVAEAAVEEAARAEVISRADPATEEAGDTRRLGLEAAVAAERAAMRVAVAARLAVAAVTAVAGAVEGDNRRLVLVEEEVVARMADLGEGVEVQLAAVVELQAEADSHPQELVEKAAGGA